MPAPLVRIATRTYPPDAGAAAFRLQALARALVAAGAEVEVVTVRPPGADRGPADRGVEVRRAPVLRDAQGAVRGYVQYLSFDVPLTARLLLGRRPDVVVHEPPPTTGLATRLGSLARRVPYVSYAPDVWSVGAAAAGAPGPVLRALRVAEAAALRGAAAVVAVTEAMAAEVRGLGVPAERVHVVGNGVDTAVFHPGAAPPPGAPVGTGLLAVYSGTMSEWQGADVFVRGFARALAELPGARLVMLGGGVDVPRLRRLAADLAPAAVELPGPVPAEVAAGWLARADVALASLRPGSGYDAMEPTKIAAAAACGTPVLFAGSGRGRAVVAEHDLGVVAEHDPDAVAAALARTGHPSAQRRAQVREWALRHGSLTAAAGRAAAVVLRVARG
ncbi:glycosyltransferase involved in cell wall biosynthesis [Kineococcus xinjiangensis]|uniref:Glycosyltransferase involved in cell wall biosynthesis n=1 Tax=Kineococcus xinjiangensis TaxID=512762 RepID=A0A2S6ITZ8_9ACTN|nr:glycosyltransferase [Kineococcus xinjiangensis]PPK97724.1 glycosyltransferase involved in cell wall biosynthesis [Kineococcus xinjiangensis]